MSLEDIAAAVTPDLVLVPAGGTGHPGSPDPRYHERTGRKSLQAACNSSLTNMQAIPRGFARAQFEACNRCSSVAAERGGR